MTLLVCAQVVGLTTAIGVIRGTGSEAFAVGLVFSIVVGSLLSAHCSPAHADQASKPLMLFLFHPQLRQVVLIVC